MATDRPDDSDADTGWIFEPQSDDEAGLSYRGKSAPDPSDPSSTAPATHHTPAVPRTPNTAAVPTTPNTAAVPPTANPAAVPPTPNTAASAASSSPTPAPGRYPVTPPDYPDPDDTGLATAPFTPTWAATRPSAASPPPGAGAASVRATGPGGGPPTNRPARQPAAVPPGSPRSPSGQPPTGGGPGQAMAVGALVGTVVLLLAWFFVLRDSGSDATRATPVRSSPVAVSQSATPTPSPVRTTATTRRTTARPSPTPTSTAPSPTPSPSSTLNDAANRLGWTYLIDGLGPVKLGLSADKASALGVLQAVPSACDAHSPSELLGATRVYSTGGEVTAIDIRTAAFPSGRGIRVGAPLETLKTMYGDALKAMEMTDGDTQIKQWALTSNSQFVAYVVGADGAVSRIVIGYRGSDGSITLPPPC